MTISTLAGSSIVTLLFQGVGHAALAWMIDIFAVGIARFFTAILGRQISSRL
jgi:hypothetical protein